MLLLMVENFDMCMKKLYSCKLFMTLSSVVYWFYWKPPIFTVDVIQQLMIASRKVFGRRVFSRLSYKSVNNGCVNSATGNMIVI